MRTVMLATEDETWTLQGDDEEKVITYQKDGVPGVRSLPITQDVLRTLAACRAKHEALH